MKYPFQLANTRSSIVILILISGLSFISLFSSVIAQDDGDAVPDAPSPEHISILAWSPDSKMIAVGMSIESCNNPLNNYNIRLLNAETLETIRQLGDSRHNCSATYLDWNPDSRYLVASYFGEVSDVWDTSTGKLVGQKSFSTVENNENKWSPDGTKIAGVDEGSTVVTIWNPFGSNDVLHEINVDSTSSLDWSPNGDQIATAYKDGLKIWDAKTGDLIQTMVARPMSHIMWSPDGKKIVGRNGSVVLVWDLSSGHISEGFEYHEASSPKLLGVPMVSLLPVPVKMESCSSTSLAKMC